MTVYFSLQQCITVFESECSILQCITYVDNVLQSITAHYNK